jgi:hypothetical protein
LEALEEQRQSLMASVDGYDFGKLWEAKRISASTYMLVHDGRGKTKSLIKYELTDK